MCLRNASRGQLTYLHPLECCWSYRWCCLFLIQQTSGLPWRWPLKDLAGLSTIGHAHHLLPVWIFAAHLTGTAGCCTGELSPHFGCQSPSALMAWFHLHQSLKFCPMRLEQFYRSFNVPIVHANVTGTCTCACTAFSAGVGGHGLKVQSRSYVR